MTKIGVSPFRRVPSSYKRAKIGGDLFDGVPCLGDLKGDGGGETGKLGNDCLLEDGETLSLRKSKGRVTSDPEKERLLIGGLGTFVGVDGSSLSFFCITCLTGDTLHPSCAGLESLGKETSLSEQSWT